MARGRSKPGAVSGPGRLSERTDLTPAGAGQPVRVASGQPYGDRGRMESLQSAAPMAASAAPGGAVAAGPPGQGASPVAAGLGGAFGPTEFPHESPMQGVGGPKVLPEDPDSILRFLYSIYPHPDIARLIDYNNAP